MLEKVLIPTDQEVIWKIRREMMNSSPLLIGRGL
jgi:hypothetical protein